MSGYVCTDLMDDIFERLPPLSIIRFRSLSKYWHSRLLSPEFLHDHRLRCSKNPKVLIRHLTYCNSDYEFKDIYILHSVDQLPLDPGFGYIGIPGVEFPYSLRTAEVVGSYNGILCLREKDDISLWNLSIMRKLMVPRHPCLEFSFKAPEVAFGFGYDKLTNDYKVVGISYARYHGSGRNDTYIYSLKTDSWRQITSSFALPAKHRLLKACYFHGTLHWVVSNDTSYYILTLNLSTHVFGHILFPRYWKVRQLTTINGSLAVVSSEGGDTWKIRAMEEYNQVESWSVLYKFQVEVSDVIRVFQHVTNGDILAYYDGETVYNPRTMLFTKLSKFGDDCLNLEMETYVESFELLDKERAISCGKTIFSWAKTDGHKRICLSTQVRS